MPNRAELTATQRKKLLIAQGALYRLDLCESKNAVRENLRVDTLAKSALHHLASTASSAIVHGFGTRQAVASFRIILPLLISAISLLAKRKSLITPTLIGAMAVAATAVVIRAKVTRHASPDSSSDDRP